MRRPAAQRVAALSREAGLLYTLNYPGLTLGAGGDADERALQEIYRRLCANWEWAWETSVEGDLERAVGMLEGGGEV